MTSGAIGSASGNVIVPITNFCQRTKEIDLTVTCAQTGWATTRARGVFYADSAGLWRGAFNIAGTFSSATITSLTIAISNVTFKNTVGFKQAITASLTGGSVAAPYTAYADVNTGNLVFTCASSTTCTAITLSGDVALDSNPTAYTTAANLEGNVNVAAYFPPASGATAGLVDGNAATWNGIKTFAGGLIGNISPTATAGADAAVTLVSTDLRCIKVSPSTARIYKLPSTGIVAGDTFTFINTSSTNLLTVQSSGANTVDTVLFGKIVVMASQDTPTSAAHWFTIEAATDWLAYTPTVTGMSTNYSSAGFYRRIGSYIEIDAAMNATGAGSAANVALALPSGATIDINRSQHILMGFSLYFNSGTASTFLGTQYLSTTTVGIVQANGGIIQGASLKNGDYLSFNFKSPLVEWRMFQSHA